MRDIEPYKVSEPVEIKLRYANSTSADAASVLNYDRVDGRTLKATFKKYPEALNGLLAAISIGGAAVRRRT
jgi:D-aminopeptidase